MRKPDPHGIWKAAADAMRQWEHNAFRVLIRLGVLDEGGLPPWWYVYPAETAPPKDQRPPLKADEVWEDRAPPPAKPRAGPEPERRDLILD